MQFHRTAQLIGLVTAITVLTASPTAQAKLFDAPGVKNLNSQATGGLFQSTPAEGAMEKPSWNLTVLRFQASGGLSQFLDLYNTAGDAIDFGERLQSDFEGGDPAILIQILPSRIEELKQLVRRMHANVQLDTAGEILRFSYGNARLGRISLGGYWEGRAGLLLSAPEPEAISLIQNWTDIGISLGGSEHQDILKGRGYGDTGGFLSYGRAFRLPRGLDLSGGAKLRIYRRWLIPEHKLTFAGELKGENDINYPEDLTHVNGTGIGLDLSATLALNDRYLDSRVSVGLRNAYAQTWYDGSDSQLDRPLPGLEVSVRPFHRYGHEKLAVGVGLDEISGSGATVGLGTLYQLGNERWNFTPRLGLVFNRADLWEQRHNLFTAGFSSRIFLLNLSGLYERDFNGDYSAGLALGLEI
jgi:hypothetical protein